MNCPSCGTPNDGNSRFCLRCGNPIPHQAASPAPQMPPAASTPQQLAGPVRSMRPISGAPGVGQPQASPPPSFPTPPPAVPQTTRMPDDYQLPPASQPYPQPTPPQVAQPYVQPQQYPQQYGQPQYPQQQYTAPASSQISSSALNIWGPFAGYGARRRHIGWLMDNQAGRYQDLLKQVNKRLKERQIPSVNVRWETLTARGLIVESRPYFIIQRGLVSLGLNIGAFGRDLFISMATYLKPPISNFRVLILGASVLFAILGGPMINWMLQLAIGSIQSKVLGNMGGLFGGSGGYASAPDFSGLALPVLCLVGPLWTLNWLALQIGFVYSAYKWLTEKDFFALLRVKPNEFNEDDLMALEKAVEQTVRSGLDDIGLNPSDLKPAAVQGSEQRLI